MVVRKNDFFKQKMPKKNLLKFGKEFSNNIYNVDDIRATFFVNIETEHIEIKVLFWSIAMKNKRKVLSGYFF